VKSDKRTYSNMGGLGGEYSPGGRWNTGGNTEKRGSLYLNAYCWGESKVSNITRFL